MKLKYEPGVCSEAGCTGLTTGYLPVTTRGEEEDNTQTEGGKV